MIESIRLTDAEIEQLGPIDGPCCCQEHGHDWHSRFDTVSGESWIECCNCGATVQP